jgi:hypothetical protein
VTVDWPRARAILLAAFMVVNLILAYSVWGPNTGLFPDLTDAPQGQSINQFRDSLLNLKLVLPANMTLPRTPGSMRFLRVELPPTPEFLEWDSEVSGMPPRRAGQMDKTFTPARPNVPYTVDAETRATVYTPRATGPAARELKLENRDQVQKAAEEYLRQFGLMPQNAQFSSLLERPEQGLMVAEWVPYYDGLPVYSGYVRMEVSARGIETVSSLWVVPKGYSETASKQVRPVSEALTRLAGRLNSSKPRTVTDIRLGYYARRTFSLAQSDDVHGWDTVPVWRITLDNTETYYINAFNGEWES